VCTISNVEQRGNTTISQARLQCADCFFRDRQHFGVQTATFGVKGLVCEPRLLPLRTAQMQELWSKTWLASSSVCGSVRLLVSHVLSCLGSSSQPTRPRCLPFVQIVRKHAPRLASSQFNARRFGNVDPRRMARSATRPRQSRVTKRALDGQFSLAMYLSAVFGSAGPNHVCGTHARSIAGSGSAVARSKEPPAHSGLCGNQALFPSR
jgi:hypothetical protein